MRWVLGVFLIVHGLLHLAVWLPRAALAAAAVSLVLVLLTFTPWFLLAVVIDVVVLVLSWWAR